MNEENPMEIVGRCAEIEGGEVTCSGRWANYDKDDSGVFQHFFNAQDGTHTINMSIGWKSQDSFKAYTPTLRRGPAQ